MYQTSEEKLREAFNELTPHEKQIFFSKIIHAINNDDFALFYADCIIKGAEQKGLFNNVKFGTEIPDLIGITNPS